MPRIAPASRSAGLHLAALVALALGVVGITFGLVARGLPEPAAPAARVGPAPPPPPARPVTAVELEAAAATAGTADAWRAAAAAWMARLAGGDATAAPRAVDAYRQVLALDPDDHDARTDMATAYLSTSDPMQAVAEIKHVLAAAPDHAAARFNYGVMLALIGRSDAAAEQFEQLLARADPASPYVPQARRALEALGREE